MAYQINLTGKEIDERLQNIGTPADNPDANGTLFARLNKNVDDVDALNDSVAHIQDEQAATDKTVAKHTADISALQTAVGDVKKDVEKNATAIAENKNAINDHEKRLSDVEDLVHRGLPVYGVEWNVNQTSSDVKRIGIPELHRTLPCHQALSQKTLSRARGTRLCYLPQEDNSGTLRDLYISAGAKYNEATGFYELNGLTDITEEEMRVIYTQWQKDVGTASHNTGWLALPPNMRTNLPSLYRADLISALSNSIGGLSVEVLCIAEQSNDIRVMYVASTQAVAQNDMPKLRRVIGVWRYNNNNPSNFNFSYGQPFGKCPLLEEIRMARINKSHTFAVSPNLSKESVLYMITNANPPSGAAVGSIAITLHPTAYARLKDDADIVAALEAKGGIVTLVSA